MEKYYLGFDTSAYTTSIGVVNHNGDIIIDLREKLMVKKGARGLRQQEAVFQHINNIPKLVERLSNKVEFNKVVGISSSYRPRNIEGSYMPVFKVGEGQADILSKVLNVPHKRFSHQDGHIGSTLISEELENRQDFLALHISGGTTEILKVTDTDKGYLVDVVGGSKDISAGQLIDRIGVKMGLNFPCGNELDDYSKDTMLIDSKIPISTDKTWINFSGTETYFSRLLDKNLYSINQISKSLLYAISQSIINIIKESINTYGLNEIVVTGGVAANSYLRAVIKEEIVSKSIGNVYFPKRKFATDNAVGIAYLGMTK